MRKQKFIFFAILAAILVIIIFLILGARKVVVNIPLRAPGEEPFNIYIGGIGHDGPGAYTKLEKTSETTWETKGNPLFGAPEEDIIILKVKDSERLLETPPSLAKNTSIKERINNEKFQNGMMIIDYWRRWWGDKEIKETNKKLKEANVKWVLLAPVWDYESLDPEPKVRCINCPGIQYSETQLRNHIKQLREDGFEVVLHPQLCCGSPPDWSVKKSKKWWDAFFKEYEGFLLYHAGLAEELGVKIFIFSLPYDPGIPAPPDDEEKRWEEVFASVRALYKGRLGMGGIICCGSLDEPGGLRPPFTEEMKLFENFDLFGISLWEPLSETDNPTLLELYKNAALTLDRKVKPIFDKYKKPIILTQVAYRSADGGSRGTEKYGVFLHKSPPEGRKRVSIDIVFAGRRRGTEERVFVTNDAKEQAMVFESLLKAIAEKPWITGFYPFVYHMIDFDFPRHPDYNVRGKPAESIIANWYSVFD